MTIVTVKVEVDTKALKDNEYEGTAEEYVQEVLDNGDTEGALGGTQFS